MFRFAEIRHLDDVRHAISEDFYLAERPWGYVINYHINAFPEIKDSMTDEEKNLEYIRREFRGIKFAKDGTILGRPFHKFFNWGEKEAEMAHFDFNTPFVIMDKLDGSMIHPVLMPEGSDVDIMWCTKMGPTEVADQAADFFHKANEKFITSDNDDLPDYESFVDEWLFSGWTPIFEWCSRRQRIVVDYPEDQLILTAIRNDQNGQYLAYDQMLKQAARYNIPVVKAWTGNFNGIEQFVEDIGGEQNCEGYIIRFNNGHMVKLKNAWYLNLHRAKSELENERNVWRLVLNQQHDDLIAQLDPDTQVALEKFAQQVSEFVKLEVNKYHTLVTEGEALYPNRKDFAINVATKAEWPSVAFKILDGKDAVDVVTEYLLAQCANAAKMEPLKKSSGINWRDFYYPVDMDG